MEFGRCTARMPGLGPPWIWSRGFARDCTMPSLIASALIDRGRGIVNSTTERVLNVPGEFPNFQGDWPDRARRAAVELARIQPADNSLNGQLLARIQSLFDRQPIDYLIEINRVRDEEVHPSVRGE